MTFFVYSRIRARLVTHTFWPELERKKGVCIPYTYIELLMPLFLSHSRFGIIVHVFVVVVGKKSTPCMVLSDETNVMLFFYVLKHTSFIADKPIDKATK